MKITKLKNNHQKPLKPIVYKTSCPFCGTEFEFVKSEVKTETTTSTFREYGKTFTNTNKYLYLDCPNPNDKGVKIYLPSDEKMWINMIKDKKIRQKAIEEESALYD